MSAHLSFLGLQLGSMVSDCTFLHCQGAIGRTAIPFSSINRSSKLFIGVNAPSLSVSIPHHPPAIVSVCKASSNKRNPDFSRNYRGSSSKNKRLGQEKESSENLEDNIPLPSKNGPLSSLSNNQRFSATATPGRREKEIVDLFRKVQAQLRERAAIKEEKKVKAALEGQEERGTVDSLLKLLRKHSVAQGKKKTGSDEGYDSDQPERNNPFDEPERGDLYEEEQNSSFFGSDNNDNLCAQDGVQESKNIHSGRPVSKFRRKSPIPKVKFQPVFSAEEEENGDSSLILKSSEHKLTSDPQSRVKFETVLEPEQEFSMKLESLDGESEMGLDQSDSFDLEVAGAEMPEPFVMQGVDLSSMKLSELRGLAKSRGIKGYTKLKKNELLELLTANC